MKNLILVLFSLSFRAFSADSLFEQEQEDIQQISSMAVNTVVENFKKDPTSARRDAHGKHHGCVKGNLKVFSEIPKNLQQGVIQPSATYPVWIRLSNGGGSVKPDSDGDGRGFAMKLMNVPGEKLTNAEQFTQDFLMINHPTFFVKSIHDYVDFQKALKENGSPVAFLFPSANPLSWRLKEANIARQVLSKKVNDPLNIQYFSMVPFKYGTEVAKFSVKPCTTNTEFLADKSNPNFLKQSLKNRLSTESACYQFMVQLQKNPLSMPIDDPTTEWSEKESPFITVAKIEIFKQTFDQPEQNEFCENISMNPWHAIAAHKPLGGMNRTRKVVYEATAKIRRELNRATPREPIADWE